MSVLVMRLCKIVQPRLNDYVCVCVNICVCARVYVYVYVYVCECEYACVFVNLYVSEYLCMCSCVCVCVWVWVCVCVCEFVCVWIFVYVCVCMMICHSPRDMAQDSRSSWTLWAIWAFSPKSFSLQLLGFCSPSISFQFTYQTHKKIEIMKLKCNIWFTRQTNKQTDSTEAGW